MSGCTAKLCVWVTEFGKSCDIMQTEKMYVHVLGCDGKPLEWCNRKYTYIPTECGHVEIRVPPGCYSVLATHSPQGHGIQPFGNRLTHVQVVRVNCGDEVCVTLFSPSTWNCGHWFAYAVRTQLDGLARVKGLDPKLARAAVAAVDAFVAKLEPDPFAANVIRMLEQQPQK